MRPTSTSIFIFALAVLGARVESHCSGSGHFPLTPHLIRSSQSYSPEVFPISEKDGPLKVSVNAYIRELGPINLDDQSYRVQITFRQKFLDPRLAHSGNTTINLLGDSVKKIWSPDTFFRNERSSDHHGTLHPNIYARIDPDGTVLMSEKISLVASCSELQKDLFQSASCHLDIASYGLTDKLLAYDWIENPIKFASDAQSYLGSRFSLKDHSHDFCNAVTSTGTYSCLRITFNIAAKP